MKKESLKSLKSGKEISAFIGLGTEFQGQLIFDGVIRLDGKFSGEIQSNGTLIIGATAQVTAEINVDTVIVSGVVHGNIRANNRVEFHASAKMYGNIYSPVLTIDEGVLFEGNCEMAELTGEPLGNTVTLISKEGESQVEAELV